MTTATRIAILDDFQSIAISYEGWAALPPEVEIVSFADHIAEHSQLIARLRDFDGVVLTRERTKLPDEILRHLPRLKLILCTGRRNPGTFDAETAARQQITACYTDGHGTPAAELAWGLILMLAHRIAPEVASFAAGGWQQRVGTQLEGKTLGILGLGTYGTRVAKFGAAFGMDLIAWSPNLTPERAAPLAVRAVSKAELFEAADVLTLHMPLSPRSRGIVGAEDLGRMKPSAYLVNTSRAGLIAHDALLNTLRGRAIAGYGTDVFEVEPLPMDDPLRHLPNVVATPHIGYVTHENYRLFYGQCAENIAAWLQGAPIRVIEPSA